MYESIHQEDELKYEIVSRWAEVHKKSLTTLLIMVSLGSRSMWSKEIEAWLVTVTGWEVTERGLYRTLQRMSELGLIEYERVNAPKTGADRKSYTLSRLGRKVAKDIAADVLGYLHHPDFIKGIKSL
jgi:PadR family transcriptional regulator, regulatory protein PadR